MKYRRIGELVAAGVVVVFAATGCGSGSNQSTTITRPPGAISGHLDASTTMPARPHPLPVVGVEPCSLLAGPSAAALGVGPGTPHGTTAAGHEAECQWTIATGPTSGDIAARILPHRSAKSMLSNPQAEELVDVDGYPAVRSTAPGADPERECLLYVDVADGQSLAVEYIHSLAGMPAGGSTMAFDIAHRAAADMMRSLGAPRA